MTSATARIGDQTKRDVTRMVEDLGFVPRR